MTPKHALARIHNQALWPAFARPRHKSKSGAANVASKSPASKSPDRASPYKDLLLTLPGYPEPLQHSTTKEQSPNP